MVDWSGSARPRLGRDSIWSCVLDADTGSVELANHPTRAAARFAVREVLVAAVDRRVLVGFDFPLGYPAGTAAAAGLEGAAPWRAMWDHLADAVVDDDRNRNNRFEVAAALNARISPSAGPFWGCPPRLAVADAVDAQGARVPAPHARGTATGVSLDGAAAPIARVVCVLGRGSCSAPAAWAARRCSASRRSRRCAPTPSCVIDHGSGRSRRASPVTRPRERPTPSSTPRSGRRRCRSISRGIPCGTPPRCSACATTSPPSIVMDGWRHCSPHR